MNDTGLVFTVYSRKECHLCGQMTDALKEWQDRFNFNVEIVDIDQDPALIERFAARIPLLALGDTEICEYFLDDKALFSAIENAK